MARPKKNTWVSGFPTLPIFGPLKSPTLMFLFEFRAIFCTQSTARQRLWARDTSWDTIMAADPGACLKLALKNAIIQPKKISLFPCQTDFQCSIYSAASL